MSIFDCELRLPTELLVEYGRTAARLTRLRRSQSRLLALQAVRGFDGAVQEAGLVQQNPDPGGKGYWRKEAEELQIVLAGGGCQRHVLAMLCADA